ncbi:hypothetical protein Leryth_020910 [Lithospermum erythrorhizon]|nr:hypothetical protein Leryth_020910 [Lithospermum erythrorhizon]
MYNIFGINSWCPITAAQAMVLSRLEEDGGTVRRRGVLTRVDRELDKGKYKEALSLVKQLQRQPGRLRGFGAIKLVPNKMLELNGLQNREISSASCTGEPSLIDNVMHSIECCRRFAIEEQEGLASESVSSVDNESNNSASEDHFMCLQHEAGHFLVGYLLGILPKRYRIPSVQDLMEERFAGGMVEFLGFEFLSEIDVADTLNKHRKKTKGTLSNEVTRYLTQLAYYRPLNSDDN